MIQRRWPRTVARTRAVGWCLPLVCALVGGAQSASGQRPTAADSVLSRALRLAGEGKAAAARALVDSALVAARDGSAQQAEALFWRASLAESGEQARRDYLRVAVEFSRSAHAEDALLRLAQAELARGDREAARRFLDRLIVEHPESRMQTQAAYWMGRVLLEQGAVAAACTALADARAHVRREDVELVNQIVFYAKRCEVLERAPARADSGTHADSLAQPTRGGVSPAVSATTAGPAVGAVSAAPVGRGAWSAQVAAFPAKPAAEALARKLAKRGYDARVTTTAPFRVRIGRFATRVGAVAEVERLRAAHVTAIVVEAER